MTNLSRRNFLEFTVLAAGSTVVGLGPATVAEAADVECNYYRITKFSFVDVNNQNGILRLGLFDPNNPSTKGYWNQNYNRTTNVFDTTWPAISSYSIKASTGIPTETGIAIGTKPLAPLFYHPYDPSYPNRAVSDLYGFRAFYLGSSNDKVASFINIKSEEVKDVFAVTPSANERYLLKTYQEGSCIAYFAARPWLGSPINHKWENEVVVIPVSITVGGGGEVQGDWVAISDSWLCPDADTDNGQGFYSNQKMLIAGYDEEKKQRIEWPLESNLSNSIIQEYRTNEELDFDSPQLVFAWTTSKVFQDGQGWNNEDYPDAAILPSVRILDMENFDYSNIESWDAIAQYESKTDPYEQGGIKLKEMLVSNTDPGIRLLEDYYGFEALLDIAPDLLEPNHEYAVHLASLPGAYLAYSNNTWAPSQKDTLIRFRTRALIPAEKITINSPEEKWEKGEETANDGSTTKVSYMVPNAELPLKATIDPDPSDSDVVWTSSNEKVAKIYLDENGKPKVDEKGNIKVIAVGPGRATITATATLPDPADDETKPEDIVYAETEVVVVELPVEIDFTPNFTRDAEATVYVGSSLDLPDPKVRPSNYTDMEFTWESEDASIVSVTEGHVSALAVGTTYIKATLVDFKTVTVLES